MKIHGELIQGTYGWLEARRGIFDRLVCTVDMPPEPPATHYHGRHCSCVEETRRPRIAYHQEDGPGPTGDAFVDRYSLLASVEAQPVTDETEPPPPPEKTEKK